MFYNLLKTGLFALDPEKSHDLTLETLKLLQTLKIFALKKAPLIASPVRVFGLDFPNPVGLAAGLDKNAECLAAWQAFGFGFIEVGTVTPKPQLGNPKPRLFRLTPDEAIINRMGFNSMGIDYLIERIKESALQCPLGVNIGKNLDTPLHAASSDYLLGYQKVYPFADYVTINLSSPNTPGLKSLQHGEELKKLIQLLKNEQSRLADNTGKKVPLLVKISPDLNKEELFAIVESLVSLKVEGIIAINTSVQYRNLLQDPRAYEAGGLSGAPLFEPSTEMVKLIYQQAGEALPLVAVGGIMNAEQANAKFAAGAKLIQLYSGLIYRGPRLVKEIIRCKREQR